MNTKLFAVLIAVAIMIGAASTQTAFSQSLQISEGIDLSVEQVIYVIILGALAGVIRSWQGYDKSPNDFDLLTFVNGIRDSVLISIPIAIGSALALPELNAVTYVILFFTVFGGTAFAHTAKKKSIPTNATDEEIEKILDERP